MSFEAGTYRLTGCPKGGSSTTYRMGMNLNGDSFDTGNGATKTITTAVFNKNVWLIVYKGTTVNNLTFYPMLIKGTEDKPYEQYGASPSIDYPSEIKTVKDSVQVNVSNSNMLDFNVAQSKKVTVNDDGTITINGTGGFTLAFKQFTAKANTKHYIKWELVSGTVDTSKSNGNSFLNPMDNTNIKQGEFKESVVESDKDIRGFLVNNMAVFTNAVIKFWANTDKSDFVEHQSKLVIMPIQQEMLEGDYIDKDGEHHEWCKLVLTGDEDWKSDWQNTDISDYIQFYLTSSIFNNNFLAAQGICNIFGKALDSVWNLKKEGYGINKDLELTLQFKFLKTRFTTVDTFKAWLKSLYEAGTPVIVYYKLATPVDLELTPEQKTVRNQKLYTYKNITNISLSDELASIDVTYKKDLETMFNNIIKQIPSSTIDTTET